MKRNCVIAACLFTVLFVGLTAFVANSRFLALRKAGIRPDNITIVDEGVDDNGKDYQVVEFSDAHQGFGFAYLVRNTVGVWSIGYSEARLSDETDLVAMGWMKTAGIRRFSVEDDPTFDFEVHLLCHGSNAIKKIELSHLLPPNVTVHIQQAGSEFTLHFVTFGNADSLGELDVHELLVSSAHISP